ncbi:hypothetical protein KFK09_024239 [Dendrobium nobile]|uniref:SLC26A/SulP transporter domain-containing protein n=1 Tax=Dendrobium nobile TaxID=94219 RepID=A0A8T3ADB3_DENNO|nr:hypothetical protein KFK09_024239 [Dendrobium nobile]
MIFYVLTRINQNRSGFYYDISLFSPILSWGREYNLQKFKGDLIAGFTIASLCIPQDIGHAKLANLDPQYGLFLGSSRDLAIGPMAVVSLMLGNLL